MAKGVYGLLAQFDSPEALKAAAKTVRDAGYRRWQQAVNRTLGWIDPH